MTQLAADAIERDVKKWVLDVIQGLGDELFKLPPDTRRGIGLTFGDEVLNICKLLGVTAPSLGQTDSAQPTSMAPRAEVHQMFESAFESADFVRYSVVSFLNQRKGIASTSAVLDHLMTLGLDRKRESLSTTLHRMKKDTGSHPEPLIEAVEGKRGKIALTPAGQKYFERGWEA